MDQQISPDPVNVDITGVVKHIRGKPARRSHIDFQGHILVRRRLEKFDVKKPFPHLESLEAFTADLFQRGGNIPQRIVVYMARFVDGFHDALAEGVGRVKYGVAAAVRQSVKGINGTGNEFFHNVVGVGLGLEKGFEILLAVEPIGGDSTHPVVRFGNYRITGFTNQGARIIYGLDDLSPGYRYAGLAKFGLHTGFAANEINFAAADTEDIKIIPQTGLGAQPVFIERVKTVDLPVAMGEKAAGPHQGIIVVHIIDLIIFGQGGTNILR